MPNFTLAANKIIELSTLNTGSGNAITVNNLGASGTAGAGNGGYGLQVDGPILFTADQQFNVTSGTASNVIQGLMLDGQLSGPFNLLKGGNGTMVLANSTNNFGGAGNFIDIQGGIVSISADGDLGDPTVATPNVVKLDVSGNQTALFGLRATDNVSLSPNRIINLAQAHNGIEVVVGKTLTVNSAFTLGATTDALYKNDNGTLALAVDNPTWAGVTTTFGTLPNSVTLPVSLFINAGAVQVQSNNALGTGGVVINATIGAALQLANNVNIANTIILNAANNNATNGGINTGGVLESVSGSNDTISGQVIPNFDSVIGADTNSSLTLTGGLPNAANRQITFSTTGTGVINLQSAIGTSSDEVNKIGNGTLNIQAAQTVTLGLTNTAAGLQINAVTVSLNGAGTLTTVTNGVRINPGGTLTLDDSGGNAGTSRLGVSTPIAINFFGGNLNVIGSTSATTMETVGLPTFNRGYSVITVTPQINEQANLVFSVANNNVAPAQNAAAGPTGASALSKGQI